MLLFKPAQIYAAVNSGDCQPRMLESTTARGMVKSEVSTLPINESEIQVSAVSNLTLPPDRCKCTISLLSRKDQPQDAKESVQRRLDYILQTLHNHQIAESDIYVTKVLQRQGGFYVMETEVVVNFTDLTKCQSISNLLVEKLDDTVKVSQPIYYHSPNSLENLRRQASLVAMKNAKQKAAEMAELLQARLGRVIGIREDYCKEWEGAPVGQQGDEFKSRVHHRIQNAVVHVNLKISATFELKSKKGKR